MPTIRKVYRSGSVAVVNIPSIHRELCGLGIGTSAEVAVHTAAGLLEEMGVSPAIIQTIALSQEHFVVVRKHHE